MGKKKNTRITSFHRTGRGKAFLFLLLLSFGLTGCLSFGKMSEVELQNQREEQAKTDLELIKPPLHINFEEPLSLEDCINIGLSNNLEVRVAKINQEIQSRETLAQKLKMLPGLNAEVMYTYRDRLRKSDVYNWELDRDEKDYTVSQLKDSGTADLTLTWNVLDTVLAYVRSGKSEMKGQILEKKRERQAQQLALDITRAFWQASAVEDALDYVNHVKKTMQNIKQEIEASIGKRDIDAMTAAESQLRLKELELTIQQLRANLSSARLELSKLMGLNQNVQYTLKREPVKPIVASLPHPTDLDIDRLEEYALTNRPELYVSDIQVGIQKKDAKAAFLNMFPMVNFFAGTHYEDNRLLLANTWNSVGAGVGLNLLELPANYAYYKGMQKAITMAEVERLMVTVGVITQVHIALLDYAIKADRFRLLEETYSLSTNLLNMARKKKQAGKLSELEVTQRHLEEMAAKLRRDEALVELLVAHKRLCVSIGIQPQNCDINLMPEKSFATAPEMEQPVREEYSGSEMKESDISENRTTGTQKKWRCPECGYIYTGDTPPEKCPVCETRGTEFGPYGEESLSTWGTQPASSPPPMRSSPGFAGTSSELFLWKIQLGAFSREGGASRRIAQIENSDLRLLDPRDADVETIQLPGKGVVNRVRFKGLTKADTERIANELKNKGMEYWIIPPNTRHW